MSTSERARENALKAALARAQRESFGAKPKGLQLGDNIFWPVADSENRINLYLAYHDGIRSTDQGEFYTPALDLQLVYNPRSELFPIFEPKLDVTDIELYAQYGDPCRRLLNTLTEDFGMTFQQVRDVKRNPTLTRYHFICAYYNDALSILRLPKTVFEEMIDFDEWPFDIVGVPTKAFRVTGETKDNGFRGYKAPKIVSKDRDASIEVEPYDLSSVAKGMYMPYRKKVTFTFRSYPDLIAQAHLTPQDFGVEELVD